MIGSSRAMIEVFAGVSRLADCDRPVLITGERGTGKDLAARLIHEGSRRAAGPYVTVDCAGASPNSIAATLFGAAQRTPNGTAGIPGRIEHAHRGTLFLDEIGGIPIQLQELLVRFLRDGEVVPVGGRRPVKVDVRIVAATKVRLRDALAAGRLRRDLYNGLNAPELHLPPLRERDGDVEVLAKHFLSRIGCELGRDVLDFTPEALAALAAHCWPGNVRELITVIERAAEAAPGPLVDVSDLRLDPSSPRPFAVRRRTAPRRVTRPKPGSDGEREAVLRALDDSRLNMSRAAQLLGVARATLYRMMRRQQIELAPPPD
jgi:two-component system NtrC family response regulator